MVAVQRQGMTGAGWFRFDDKAAARRGHVRVFYFVPERIDPESRILVALHGLDRAASAFRDMLVAPAERLGRVLLVPEFDHDEFPDVYAFNYGNVVSAPPRSRFKAREDWNFDLIDRLFIWASKALDLRAETFDLYGNSAGSQYVLRYIALTPAPLLQTAISSNSGFYMLPDIATPYPYGLGGTGTDEDALRRYLSRPLHILLGDQDTDSTAHDLPRVPEALAQGPHRLARGLWYGEHCRSIARGLGVNLTWTIEIVPGAGHVSQLIFDRAVALSG